MTPSLQVVDLQILSLPAVLAPPSIPSQDFLAQFPIGLGRQAFCFFSKS